MSGVTDLRRALNELRAESEVELCCALCAGTSYHAIGMSVIGADRLLGSSSDTGHQAFLAISYVEQRMMKLVEVLTFFEKMTAEYRDVL